LAGLYIHIPFCKQACYYCDFHFSTNSSYRDRMIGTISDELILQKDYLDNEIIDTIYFGGGTPSILENKNLIKLLKTIEQTYSINNNPEITLEANPDDLSLKKLYDLKSIGVNRLSIGIQSFHDKTLAFLNRAHNSTEAINCIENARKAGFTNISIDLIFSIPGLTIADLENDISKALALYPEHISVYSLTVEEKTAFGRWQKKGKFRQVSNENSAKQFELLISMLNENNFEQYEISNFCRDDYYSRHNTSYWKNVKYLGVGPGAHSYNGKSRQFNIPNNHKYMKSIEAGIVPMELDDLDEKAKANEFLLTSLRTKWGCSLNSLEQHFNYPLLRYQQEKVNQLLKQQLIKTEKNTIFLTMKGKFLADEIISDLFWI
jgi:oxygen-independent coproporphyrinogen-3 oxidase